MNAQWNRTELSFETERLAGVLTADDADTLCNHRLRALVHKPTDTLVSSDHGRRALGQFGLSLFRVYARDACLTELRAIPPSVERRDDGARLTWAPTLRHQAKVELTMTVAEPNIIDLDISVEGYAHYRDYEILLSNYVAPGFAAGAYVRADDFNDPTPEQIRLVDHPAFHGMYNFFPRDDKAANILTDGRGRRGRWYWRTAIGRLFATPMCFFSDQTVDVVMMARPEDVSAVGVTYAGDEEHDPTADHRGMYLTLFGRDLHPGQGRRTRARLLVDDFKASAATHQQLYDTCLAETVNVPRRFEVAP
jgi:hypothetical protein